LEEVAGFLKIYIFANTTTTTILLLLLLIIIIIIHILHSNRKVPGSNPDILDPVTRELMEI